MFSDLIWNHNLDVFLSLLYYVYILFPLLPVLLLFKTTTCVISIWTLVMTLTTDDINVYIIYDVCTCIYHSALLRKI